MSLRQTSRLFHTILHQCEWFERSDTKVQQGRSEVRESFSPSSCINTKVQCHNAKVSQMPDKVYIFRKEAIGYLLDNIHMLSPTISIKSSDTLQKDIVTNHMLGRKSWSFCLLGLNVFALYVMRMTVRQLKSLCRVYAFLSLWSREDNSSCSCETLLAWPTVAVWLAGSSIFSSMLQYINL